MTRREALARSAILLGGTLSAGTIAAVLSGCQADSNASPGSTFLDAAREKMVAEMCDLILPKTSTPSATEVGVPAFIYLVLQDCHPQADRDAFATGLKMLDEQAGGFSKMALDGKVAFLKKLDAEARSAADSEATQNPAQLAWRRLKELTIVGYFTSEIGASEVLEYVPVPAKMEGCNELTAGQRAWAI